MRTRVSAQVTLHIGTGLIGFHTSALLGQGPSDVHESTPAEHVALFMCPHCVIGGCGVVSARIEHGDRWTTWTAMGHDWPILTGIGPFRFGSHQYEAAVTALLTSESP
ncbi:hypothetical protein [Dactylosporangium sp. CA-139066]|uniref:hypothetical protein n=1 Tax=Dactylosporangium sp. CA-139066 TaxID=3239930 RepID=UPI003D9339B4